MSQSWSWSQSNILVSLPSRSTLLAAARQRQRVLMQEWNASRGERLANIDRILAEASPATATEQASERVLATATLGQHLRPHSGLGQQRRTPRNRISVEEQHAQLHTRLMAAAAPHIPSEDEAGVEMLRTSDLTGANQQLHRSCLPVRAHSAAMANTSPAWIHVAASLHILYPDISTPRSEWHRLSLARTVTDRLSALFSGRCEVEWRPGGNGVYLRLAHSIGVMQVFNWEDIDQYVAHRLTNPEEWDEEEEEEEDGVDEEEGEGEEQDVEEEGDSAEE